MQLPPKVLEYFQQQGRIGGLQRKQNLTAAERSRIARKAVNARWARVREVAKERSQ